MSSATAGVSTVAGSTPKPASTESAPKSSQQAPPPPPPPSTQQPQPSPPPKQAVTVVSAVEATDSFIALEPAPTDPSPQSSPNPSKQQSSQAPASTSSAAPSKTKAKATVLSSEQPTPIPVTTRSETTFVTSTPSSVASSIASSSSSSPSLVPLGGPFQGSADSTHHGKNKSGPTIAGVVGGLSAAILLGVLAFFLWKWKTRGKYGANKRQSFGPYGNGIDANRGGLLVSSVACKPADSLSNHEESLYSDENSPTRYDRPSFDANKNREPTLPKIGDLSDRGFMPSSPPKTATFGMDQAVTSSYPGHSSYRPNDSMMAVAGVGALAAGAGAMAAAHHRSPVRSHGGVLYEPRRPPLPPSMRRNRSPPQAGNGAYGEGDYTQPGIPRSNSMGSQPMFNRSMPQLNNGYGPPPPALIPGRMPPMRQVRRSASVSGSDLAGGSRYSPNSSPFDPLSMHPVIFEVPSGPTTPVPAEMAADNSPPGSMTTTPVEVQRRPLPLNSRSPNGPAPTSALPRPPMDRWNTAGSEADKPKVLTVRNPSPEPDMEEKKKEKGSGSPIGSIVRRVSNMGREKEPTMKPGDAAKNF
jgi:hypothetical protein